MKPPRSLSASGAVLSAAFLMAFVPSARATPYPDLTYRVTLNTSSLEANANGPFALDLQLISDAGGAVSNTVTLSSFTFTGGSASGTPEFTVGGETGSFGSSVVLTNSGSDDEIAEDFSSGVSQISFNVDETRNSDVVGSGTATPDQFNVAILDPSTNNITTNDPSGGNTLVSSDLISSETLPQIGVYTSSGDDSDVIATVVPEPSSSAMFLVGAFGLLGVFGLRRQRAA